jgi:hypothetical protein
MGKKVEKKGRRRSNKVANLLLKHRATTQLKIKNKNKTIIDL